MPHFSKRSAAQLATCHPDLQWVLEEAIRHIDFTVLEGHRDKDAQNAAVADGKSKVRWPNGKHNSKPSLAVDIAPYPIDWKNWRRFDYLAGYIMGIASQMGITLRWGGDWDSDHDFADQTFHDLPHFELRGY